MSLANYPTCPNCGLRVLPDHLEKGDEVCIHCGPTRDLDTYGELEKERYNNWKAENEQQGNE